VCGVGLVARRQGRLRKLSGSSYIFATIFHMMDFHELAMELRAMQEAVMQEGGRMDRTPRVLANLMLCLAEAHELAHETEHALEAPKHTDD